MGKSKTLKPQESALLQRHVAIDGDGNVVGNDNTVQVTKQTAGDYAVQVGEQCITVNVAELRSVLNVEHSQVGVIGNHAHVDKVIFKTAAPTNPRERRNRAAMLQLVHNTWIKGVLEQSLHGAAMLELGKDYNPQAVERPWDLEYHLPGQEPRPVPEGTTILEIFDQCSGALLILGDPGSGKTTTLLELARELIARAEADQTAHIPVVFNLSSWALKQQSLEDWLVGELRTKYYIPKKVAQGWLENDTLLLLLDGLDEVKAEAREKCITAINAFRQKHLVPLAVCSRTTDYENLTNRLHLQGAICLRPLTPAQIDAYLAGAGTELQAVRVTLQRDPVLQELAQSPLMLSIMTLAYRGLTKENLTTLATSADRRRHLFDTYIVRIFQRRAKDSYYVPKQTLHWLAWLAKKMKKYGITTFFIIHPQPYWLPGTLSRRVQGLAFLITGLCFALSGALFGTLVGFIHYGQWIFGLAFALFGVVIGLIFTLLGSPPDTVNLYATNTYSWLEPRNGLIIGLPNELIGTSFLWLMIVLAFELILYVGMIIFGDSVGELSHWLTIGIHIWLILTVLVWGRGVRMIILYHTLRYILAHTNRAPRNYPRFLDYCSERIFLHKVGGGYIFVHRLLQEHFGSLTPEDIERLAANADA